MRQDQQGVILVSTLIILTFLSVLGMNLIVYLLSRTTSSALELDRVKAFYLAEAGMAQSIHELKLDKDMDNNGLGNVLKTSLGGGSYKAVHNFQNSTITGIGEYNGVKRRVQIKYNPL